MTDAHSFAKVQLQPNGARKVQELVAIVKTHVARSLNPQDGSAQPTQAEINTWIDFITFVDRDGALHAELGPKRYEADLKDMQAKIKKLEQRLKEMKKGLASVRSITTYCAVTARQLDSQPIASEYLTNYLRATDRADEMSKLLSQCEGDVGRLDSQLEYKDYAPLFEAPANSKVHLYGSLGLPLTPHAGG